MKTKIKTIHEEKIITNSNDRILGILYNYQINDNINEFKDSLMYTYKDNVYIFFITITDMINYLLYGDVKMKRAYMEENEFDELFDSEYIDGKFYDKLNWLS